MKRNRKSEVLTLYNSVIKNNYCIGCGLCTTIQDSPFTMYWNESGLKEPCVTKELSNSHVKVLDICPFYSNTNEDEIANNIFKDATNRSDKIGRFHNCYVGYANELNFREVGTSGGILRWLAYNLLKSKQIDYFIQVMPSKKSDEDELFNYQIIRSDEVLINEKAKSAYYPVSLNEIIEYIKKNEGKYAISTIPCYSKALRLYAIKDELIRNRIKFILGIVCGSMKSAHYALSIAWQQGVDPKHLKHIDFREKINNKPAYVQGNAVWDHNGTKRCKSNHELFDTDYGMGFFKPKACDYCDDVFAETADISLGDAWLPEYNQDDKGNSIIITRNQFLDDYIKTSISDGKLHVNTLSLEKIIESQEASLRHRREGLAFRLYEKKLRNKWTPPKRVTPNNQISSQRKKIYKLRETISERSHKAFNLALNKNSIEQYYKTMTPYVNNYKKLYYPNITTRIDRILQCKIFISKTLKIIGLHKPIKTIYKHLTTKH